MIAIVVPGAPGLLPCAGLQDPFADVRAAAVAALGELPGGVRIVASSPQERAVGESLVAQAGIGLGGDDVVVVADGSATRSEKAPGYLDLRSHTFDETITAALADGDPAALAALDPALAEELWCRGVPALHELARLLPEVSSASVSYADDPFGVMYWVARWES